MVGDIMQPTHLLFVLVVALLVLGPKRLPEVGRQLGNGLRDFRSAINGEHSGNHDQVNGAYATASGDHDFGQHPEENAVDHDFGQGGSDDAADEHLFAHETSDSTGVTSETGPDKHAFAYESEPAQDRIDPHS